jgi:hypothetical protein
MNWVAFSYSLPAKSGSSPRVALWRRLRRLGAIAPVGGVQVLPDRQECVEAFQWLAQEMRQAGGEAMIMHVEQFSGLGDRQLVEMFQAARLQEYTALNLEIAEWETTIPATIRPEDFSKLQEGLVKLRRQHTEIMRVDYFASPAGLEVAARLAQLAQAFAATMSPAAAVVPVDVARYRERRWVTRPLPHVDRLACIWLIRRFVDPAARIAFGPPSSPNDVTFDMQDAEFGHVGNLCTFETMLRAFNLTAPALDEVAQIVHELDLRDGIYVQPETPGIDAILAGWLAADLPDEELELHGIALFDGLYAALARRLATAASGKA